MSNASPRHRPRRRGARGGFWALLLGGVVLLAGFVALGSWQLQRLAWKQDLLARLEQRLGAAPTAAPGAPAWPRLAKAGDEYRRISVRGRFDHQRETLVRASTELGSGYWVLTPLRSEDGFWLLVNRGFVPPALRERGRRAADESTGEQSVEGLLRLSEPGGSLLQRNEPAAGRWYSRDVAAIAAARALSGAVAPYFLDVWPVGSHGEAWPRPGLTVLKFSNNHRVYALTWFALAAMVAAALVYLLRSERGRDGDADGDCTAD